MPIEVLPRVSVAIRVHGDQPFLMSAIESVRAQKTNFLFDIWLILDRPSDSLLEEIRTCSGLEVRLFYPSSQGTAGPLRELLFELDSGYVAILDSDDLMLEDRLQKQFDFLQKNPGVAVVGTGIIMIDEYGNEFARKGYSQDPGLLRANRYVRIPVAHPSVMFRRSIILQVGSYRTFYSYAEDLDLWLRVLEVADISNLPEFLTKYRIHANQTVSQSQERNVLAGIAARKSAIQRQKGLKDYSEQFESIDALSNKLTFRVELFWRILKLKLWSGLTGALRQRRYFKVLFFSIPIALIDSRSLLSKILAQR
jgi:glycosyltransferase involved in cell wall biosynthesis